MMMKLPTMLGNLAGLATVLTNPVAHAAAPTSTHFLPKVETLVAQKTDTFVRKGSILACISPAGELVRTAKLDGSEAALVNAEINRVGYKGNTNEPLLSRVFKPSEQACIRENGHQKGSYQMVIPVSKEALNGNLERGINSGKIYDLYRFENK